jgi:TrkA-C domain.
LQLEEGDEVIVSPNAQEKFLEGDVIFIVGRTEDLVTFKEAFEK